jgi:signal transduction histidine kinase
MSHELRTPLNAIIGFSEIMKGELFGPLGHESYKEYALDIYESGRHLLTLINDILDVSKAEAGRIELEEELVELRPVVDACVRLVKARAESGEVALSVKLVEAPPKLCADERRLKQIMLNLLSNAVKFTLPGGRVQVEAIIRANGDMSIVVADTGIGIAPEDIPRVLAPFGQVEGGLNRKYEGTGLGLTLTKALIELHGGHLEIDSVKGLGTKAAAVFPAERVRAHDAEPDAPHNRGRLRRLKVAAGR